MKQAQKLPTIRRSIIAAWNNAQTLGVKPSPLMMEVAAALLQLPNRDKDFKNPAVLDPLNKVSNRIASSSERGPHACLDYCGNIKGEWEVTDADLVAFSKFCAWLYQLLAMNAQAITGRISQALKQKRLQQALDRFTKSGLTREHCRLLASLQFQMDTQRGPVASLYVSGVQPFGTKLVIQDIYQYAQRNVDDWPETGPTAAHIEWAMDLMDELTFAAPEAARKAEKAIESEYTA